MRFILFVSALGLACAGLVGLARGSSLSTNDLASGSSSSTNERAQARSLYLNKCSKCHKLYNPGDYEEARWQTLFGKMSRKAKLTPEQEQLLSVYVNDARQKKDQSQPSR